MKFFVNLDSGLVTSTLSGTTAATPAFNFQSITPIELQFHRGGIPERLATGTDVVFAFKEANKFDTDPAASVTGFTRPSADDGFYLASLNTNTVACAALLAADETLTNDAASKPLGVQVSYQGSGDTLPIKSQIMTGTLRNAIIRDGDVPPVENPGGGEDASGSYEALTAVTASGNTDVTPASMNHAATVAVNGSGTFTRTFALLTAGRTAGDRIRLTASISSGVNRTLEVRNATSGGTLLASALSQAGASRWTADLVFTGSAWTTLDAGFVV